MPPYRRLIALIEDDVSVRKAFERQIYAAGYRCETFATAEDYVAVAHTCRAAAVVCDIHLAGMTGLQLALHPEVTRLDVPVVLMTASVDPLIEVAAREISAVFLRKPFSRSELLDAIVDTAGPPIADGD